MTQPVSFPGIEEYPITELQDDAPEGYGKVGLFDYFMRVGTSGIFYVGAMAGTLYPTGPVFTPAGIASAQLRAASTCAQTGLVSGDTLSFFRQGLQYTQQQAADSLGVLLATYQTWEANTAPVPISMWMSMAEAVCRTDGKPPPALQLQIGPPDFRARTIRIFPNAPSPGMGNSPPACPPGMPPNCPTNIIPDPVL